MRDTESTTLGAMPGGGGVEFALFSRHATAVELCLFDHVAAMAESRRLLLCRGEGNIWRTRVEDLGPGPGVAHEQLLHRVPGR